MRQGRNERILNDASEEFRKLMVKEIYRNLGDSEKEAAETGQTIVGALRISLEQEDELLLLVHFICEPGQTARVLTAGGPMQRYALSLEHERPLGRRLH
jgi:hypothetical protein